MEKDIKLRGVAGIVALVLLVFVLMLGSGYIGARIAQANIHIPAVATAEYVPLAETDNGNTLLRGGPFGRQTFTLPDLFDEANPAVVAISIEITGRNAFGEMVTRPAAGSGFLISPEGYIVTNDHVIENASTITVLRYDGSVWPATVVGRDPDSDLAVIKIDAAGLPFLTFANSDAIRVGEQVAAIGNPLGELANSMTVGYISALNRYVSIDGVSQYKLQTDAAVNRGNSGGPLLNLHGQVVGVVSAKTVGTGVEGLGFAIPANHVYQVTGQLMEYGFVRGRAVMGVTIGTQPGVNEMQIMSVNEGSAAQRAGVEVNDVILVANGMAVPHFSDLRRIMDALSPGDTLVLLVRRGDYEIELTLILDEFNPMLA